MASPIVVGDNYFIDFEGAQGGDVANYVTYPANCDTNFVTLQDRINTMIVEINAFQGQNAPLGLDLMIMDDPDRDQGDESSGIVGIGSYQNAIVTDTLTIEPGVALIAGLRVEQATQVVKTASGGAGDRFLALDTDGVPTLEVAANAQALDIYSFTWNGSILSAPIRLVNVLNDGDDYEFQRKRRATIANMDFAADITFNDNGGSPDTITRATGSFTTEGFVTGQTIVVAGSASNDGPFVLTDVPDALTLEVATGSFTAEGPVTDVTVSVGFFVFNDFDAVHERFEDIENMLAGVGGIAGEIAFGDGTAALPGIAFADDLDTGFYRPTDDELAAATAGVQAFHIDPNGQVTRPLQAAGYVSLASQAITTGAGQVIAFDTELFDRQSQHSSGTVTVGSVGEAGLYQINAEGTADESGGGATGAAITLEIRDGTTVRAKAEVAGVGSGSGGIVGFNLSVLLEFSNSDTFDVFATQASTSSLTFSDLRLSWSKVA